MWEMYDELIDMVPVDCIATDFIAGLHWIAVRSEGVGLAMTPREGGRMFTYSDSIPGSHARNIATNIKSWNNYDAALGLAAINSVVNVPEKIYSHSPILNAAEGNISIFDYMADTVQGKKVAVVGHFRGLESIANICQLSILERFPIENDLPDPACEYILPEQDYVFITGTTLINKTLPRLLSLSKNATVALVGPSTPMTPALFKYGIDILAGTTVIDGEKVLTLIQGGDQHRFFSEGGQMVKLVNKDNAISRFS